MGRVEFQFGDVRDPDAVARALEDVDVVFHQAAAVGVGQSMYRIAEYVSANSLGTSVLLDGITSRRRRPSKLLVASSMALYGEGKYRCPEHGEVDPPLRGVEQFQAGDWEVRCPRCGLEVIPMPTDERKPLHPTSVYAITKRDQEELFLATGRAYDIPTVALRYFNVYGPGQSLDNPYTGVAAIFTSRLLNRRPPLVYEDGRQSRDFVHVSDIVRANLLALDRDEADGQVYNVGTGRSLSLFDVVEALRRKLGGPAPEFLGVFRQGDIRHCYADIAQICESLGYQPQVRFEDGIDDLAAWAAGRDATDRVEQARFELESARLTV
jgi:dTDP-L-rhamnose 4-epimerase